MSHTAKNSRHEKDVYSKITQQGQQGFDNSANTSVGSPRGSTGPGRSLLSRIALFVTVLPRDAVTIVRTIWRHVCVCVCVCAGAGSSVTLEVCNTETFNPTCPRNEVIIVERALYGRLQLGQRTRRRRIDRHLYTLLAYQTATPPIILKVAVARWRTARVIISLTCLTNHSEADRRR